MTPPMKFRRRNDVLLSDERFDSLFPNSLRIHSHFHWTPVEVAVRACALIAPTPVTRVLDIGSGVGKLCLVGALTTRASWWGIERDAAQIRAATVAARELAVEQRARFIHGDFASLDWSNFDALYFFNPFVETLFEHDRAVSERQARYHYEIDLALSLLAETRPGTRVVTYYGLGGDMPDTFDLVLREPAGRDELCLWIKRGSRTGARARRTTEEITR